MTVIPILIRVRKNMKKKNKDYLERTALQNAVKAWISKRAKFTK